MDGSKIEIDLISDGYQPADTDLLGLRLVYSEEHGDVTKGVIKSSETIGLPVEAVIGTKKKTFKS
ncbi:hypothetical protein THO17_21130 [Marinomonas sp. THO17]